MEGLDMTYKVGQVTAKARLDAWMTPDHDLGPCRVRRSDRAMDAGLRISRNMDLDLSKS